MEIGLKVDDLKEISDEAPEGATDELAHVELLRVAEALTTRLEDELAKKNLQIIRHGDLPQCLSDRDHCAVDFVLKTKLTGYGKIKRSWVLYLIGSGVVEGVVEGAVAFSVSDNPWVALGVGGEEILQEVVTWGGGVYLFDHYFTPVIIEAKLVTGSEATDTVWSETAFEIMSRHGLKKRPKEERGKKEVRLEVTAQKTIKELVKSLTN
jgi:hypothetical protein